MKLQSEFEAVCPCCQATLVIDVNLRRVVRPRGRGARRSPRARQRGAHPRRRGGAARVDLPEVGRRRADPRRRAVEALRRGAEAGAAGADHEADAGFRSRLRRRGARLGFHEHGITDARRSVLSDRDSSTSGDGPGCAACSPWNRDAGLAARLSTPVRSSGLSPVPHPRLHLPLHVLPLRRQCGPPIAPRVVRPA